MRTFLKWLAPVAALVVVAGGVRPVAAQQAVPVEVRVENGRAQLLRGGRPYYVLGAGGGGGRLATVAARGGNSVRTWSTRGAQAILDSAQALGLTVTLGLDVARERHGFDYNDTAAVAAQREKIRAEVLRYKDHPALLAWAIGNELNLSAKNPRVWNAVDEISRMIHAIDPAHPTTTTLAGIDANLLRALDERAPDLDLLSIQMYGGIMGLPAFLRAHPIGRPYLVTEWGATGHWEVAKTPWGAAIEDHSSRKADVFAERYRAAIAADTSWCVGSYVFLWGQKQERTPTWYGLFLESGEATEAVDVMQTLWTGRRPANGAPRLEEARLDGRTAYDAVRLRPGARVTALVRATDPDGDPLRYRWDLKPESTDLKEGGDFETTPPSLDGRLSDPAAAAPTFTAPEQAGAYRLFVYVFDGQGHAAHANIPFYVEP